MARMRKRFAAAAAIAAASVTLAACGSSGSSSSSTPAPGGDGSGSTSPTTSTTGGTGTAGGTVTLLQYKSSEHYDPQRMYVGRDLADFGRLAYRSLVAFPTSLDPKVANVPQPDLATDTGTMSNGAKTWKFTLKDGVKWQDGKDITCDDLKYGVSRSFATDVIIGGPNYILGYLDIPTDKSTGQPEYTGPYKSSAAGKAAFDKAVTCSGKTITYHFKKPWPDFPLAIASLRCFDPYRQDLDQGDKSNFTIFSDGPYMTTGKIDPEKGFTMVRNPMWDASTDTIRKAYPDAFKFVVGTDPDTQYQELIADQVPDAITTSSVPPEDYSQITGAVADRSVLINSPFTDYALPNFNSTVMKNPIVREALAMSTNKEGWNNALGGEKASKPAYSIVNPAVPGYIDNPTFKAIPDAGDPTAAKKLLTDAGLTLPIPIKFTYPGGTSESENAAAALKDTWDKAGFKTTLNELPDTYYTVVQAPDFKSDVVFGGWGADWPSIGTVIPPLFDDRINITKSSNGQDYGNFANPGVDAAMDAAGKLTDLDAANTAYAAIDQTLGKTVAYIPLDISQFYYLRGSNISGYINSLSTSGYPDLATISLKDTSK